MRTESLNYRSFFAVERRLLMDYYPGKWAGLSEWAFRRYIMVCASVRKYSDECYCTWNGFNHMTRAGGMSTTLRGQYDAANEELWDKHFMRRRPDLESPRRPEWNEVLVLPDYIGGRYIPSPVAPRTEETLRGSNRSFILAPMVLAKILSPAADALFHNACTDAWAVMLKMYEYMIWGGVDPNAVRMEQGRLWVHPSVCEELHMTVDELAHHLAYWQRRGWMEFQPIECRSVDTVGSYQLMYEDEGTRASEVYALRLKYQPDRAWRVGDADGV